MIFFRRWNSLPVFTLLVLFLILGNFSGCKSSSDRKETKPDPPPGWVSGHSYLVESKGLPDNGTTGFVRRRGSAKRNALREVREKASRELFGKPYAELGNKNYQELIDSGILIKTSYTPEDECTLQLVITSDNLQEKIEYLQPRNRPENTSPEVVPDNKNNADKIENKPSIRDRNNPDDRKLEPDEGLPIKGEK